MRVDERAGLSVLDPHVAQGAFDVFLGPLDGRQPVEAFEGGMDGVAHDERPGRGLPSRRAFEVCQQERLGATAVALKGARRKLQPKPPSEGSRERCRSRPCR